MAFSFFFCSFFFSFFFFGGQFERVETSSGSIFLEVVCLRRNDIPFGMYTMLGLGVRERPNFKPPRSTPVSHAETRTLAARSDCCCREVLVRAAGRDAPRSGLSGAEPRRARRCSAKRRAARPRSAGCNAPLRPTHRYLSIGCIIRTSSSTALTI
ncbi:hypothetical protein BDY21DRAFT_146302 [Lineolata rhizophorae]|uniref:Secreted protein n=1 Tax=Lineolata rhizophorae TaxID=578093 RepID=A0A6A6NN21_9PEZI|nr:hypothetical protein BDY21DRAFT_146302 [Lineolata rhizophorae]